MDLVAGAGFTDYRFGIEWSRSGTRGRIHLPCGCRPLPADDRRRPSTRSASVRDAAPLHAPTLVRPHRRLAARRRGATLSTATSTRSHRCSTQASPASAPSMNRTSLRCSPPTPAGVCPRCAAVSRCPIRRSPTPSIDVHHAARSQIKSAHPTVDVGWGVSVQDCYAEPGAEHLLADYTRPRDEVFLEAAADDDWVGVQTYTRIRVGAGPDGRPVEVWRPRGPSHDERVGVSPRGYRGCTASRRAGGRRRADHRHRERNRDSGR